MDYEQETAETAAKELQCCFQSLDIPREDGLPSTEFMDLFATALIAEGITPNALEDFMIVMDHVRDFYASDEATPLLENQALEEDRSDESEPEDDEDDEPNDDDLREIEAQENQSLTNIDTSLFETKEDQEKREWENQDWTNGKNNNEPYLNRQEKRRLKKLRRQQRFMQEGGGKKKKNKNKKNKQKQQGFVFGSQQKPKKQQCSCCDAWVMPINGKTCPNCRFDIDEFHPKSTTKYSNHSKKYQHEEQPRRNYFNFDTRPAEDAAVNTVNIGPLNVPVELPQQQKHYGWKPATPKSKKIRNYSEHDFLSSD